MQTNNITSQESKFLNIAGKPTISNNKQSITIVYKCGCSMTQNFLIGFKGKFKKENERHINIEFCKIHK